MSIILVSDVFGITPALLKMSEAFGECSIVDPYSGQAMGFKNESEAYSYFVEAIGFDKYLAILLEAVGSVDKETTLIGFSVGAAAIWRSSEEKVNSHVKQAFCFYGSQIRNFTDIVPSFSINLIFPSSEPHFDVVELQNNLSLKANVKTQKVKYLHGFMNYHSNNYDHSGYTEHINVLRSLSA